VRVQGVEAAGEIAQAIREFNHYQLADVLIVGRGGGSIEDLWPFNEEIVAQAIFESRIPVISAVGHETDYCIADLVADVRAPTPSAAAELVVSEKAHHIQALAGYTQRMDHALLQMLRQYTQRLKQLTQHPSLSSPYTLLGMRMQRLDEARSAIDRCMIHTLQRTRLRLQGLQRQASALSPQTQIQQSKTRLEQLEKHLNQIYFSLPLRQKEQLRRMKANLDAIAPQNLLQKGYSILFSENTGSVISTAQALASATRIRARLSDGELLATLKDIEVSCQTTAQK
ncbi:MAG: exodeoxyribonuclease VII large subunit, partial [Chlamydiia bacterium]|nr:exodeoxyribonuclease VII large subunit [Chlamydiia bacterium]